MSGGRVPDGGIDQIFANWGDPKSPPGKNSGARYIHNKSIWIRKRAPNAMNRDELGPLLSHLYDPLLISSATARTPSTCRYRGQDHQF